MMRIDDYALPVFEMRQAQREYLAKRDPSMLRYSKVYEKKVDEATREIMTPSEGAGA